MGTAVENHQLLVLRLRALEGEHRSDHGLDRRGEVVSTIEHQNRNRRPRNEVEWDRLRRPVGRVASHRADDQHTSLKAVVDCDENWPHFAAQLKP